LESDFEQDKTFLMPAAQPIIASRGLVKRERYGRRKLRMSAAATVGSLLLPIVAATLGELINFTLLKWMFLPTAALFILTICLWILETPKSWTEWVPKMGVKPEPGDEYKLYGSKTRP